MHDVEEEDAKTNDGEPNAETSSGRQKSSLSQKRESERSISQKKNSYAYKRASEESEEWIQLDIRGNTRDGGWTDAKKECMEKVKCTKRGKDLKLSSGMAYNGGYVKSLNYLDSVTAGGGSFVSPIKEDLSDWKPSRAAAAAADTAMEEDFEEVIATSGPMGETEMAAAELAAKLVVLLQNGNGSMIPYQVIRSRLNAEAVSDEVLTMALSSCAVLVRGNFCLKSSLAQFINVGGSGNTRGKAMRELRDLILLLLNMHGMVQRGRLIRVYCEHDGESIINPETITFLLRTVAKRSNADNCWIPKVEDDELFAAKFPEVATSHGVYWVKKKAKMKKLVEMYESVFDEMGF
jgi:DNA-directed RNA polymerase-3 subunit RPC5